MNAAATIDPLALAGMALFLGLPPPALAEVLASAQLRRLPKDTVVFRQDETAGCCHALVEGRVRIIQTDEDGMQLLVRFIGPGEMFGTVALFTDSRYPAEAATVVDSVEISWTEAALLGLIDRRPRIALNLVRIVGARLREVQERLRELATQRVERRIAHAVLRLAAQAGRAEGGTVAIDFPLTRKDVAEMCGATLHTASRIMTDWERRGLLATNRQHVTVHDLDALRRIAEDPPR